MGKHVTLTNGADGGKPVCFIDWLPQTEVDQRRANDKKRLGDEHRRKISQENGAHPKKQKKLS